jgi:hypothetical protein
MKEAAMAEYKRHQLDLNANGDPKDYPGQRTAERDSFNAGPPASMEFTLEWMEFTLEWLRREAFPHEAQFHRPCHYKASPSGCIRAPAMPRRMSRRATIRPALADAAAQELQPRPKG